MAGQKAKHGFTLVELLIVVVVIAILAAISVVAYRGIQTRSQNTVNKQIGVQLSKKIGVYKAIYGEYPVMEPVAGVGEDAYIADPANLAEVLSAVPEAVLDPDLIKKLGSHGQTGDNINLKPVGYSPCPYGDNGLSGGRVIIMLNPIGLTDVIFIGDGLNCF